MMLLHRGEKILKTSYVNTRYGKCTMYVSNKHVLLEKQDRGCIMMLSLRDVHSCSQDSGKRSRGANAITIRHNNGSHASIRTTEAAGLVDAVNSALAQYRCALVEIGADPHPTPDPVAAPDAR